MAAHSVKDARDIATQRRLAHIVKIAKDGMSFRELRLVTGETNYMVKLYLRKYRNGSDGE